MAEYTFEVQAFATVSAKSIKEARALLMADIDSGTVKEDPYYGENTRVYIEGMDNPKPKLVEVYED